MFEEIQDFKKLSHLLKTKKIMLLILVSLILRWHTEKIFLSSFRLLYCTVLTLEIEEENNVVLLITSIFSH